MDAADLAAVVAGWDDDEGEGAWVGGGGGRGGGAWVGGGGGGGGGGWLSSLYATAPQDPKQVGGGRDDDEGEGA